jgi:hypothetical protein
VPPTRSSRLLRPLLSEIMSILLSAGISKEERSSMTILYELNR